MNRLTTRQVAALKAIADDDEGTGYPGTAEFPMSTARALLSRGLIEIKSGGCRTSTVVGGLFGRGYTTRHVHTGISVRLTAAGRAAVTTNLTHKSTYFTTGRPRSHWRKCSCGWISSGMVSAKAARELFESHLREEYRP